MNRRKALRIANELEELLEGDIQHLSGMLNSVERKVKDLTRIARMNPHTTEDGRISKAKLEEERGLSVLRKIAKRLDGAKEGLEAVRGIMTFLYEGGDFEKDCGTVEPPFTVSVKPPEDSLSTAVARG